MPRRARGEGGEGGGALCVSDSATVVHTIGIDTGKNTLHLIGLETGGNRFGGRCPGDRAGRQCAAVLDRN